MRFPPMTKDDIENASKPSFLLKEGICSFKIKGAEEKVSQNNNPMLVLELDVSDGIKSSTVKDRIVYTDKALWKLVEFCEAIDREKFLLEGSIPLVALSNLQGMLEIEHDKVIDPVTGNTKTYNRVKRYIGDKAELQHLKTVKFEQQNANEDIPF